MRVLKTLQKCDSVNYNCNQKVWEWSCLKVTQNSTQVWHKTFVKIAHQNSLLAVANKTLSISMDHMHLCACCCCFLLFCFLMTLITWDNTHKERCTGTKSHKLPKSMLKNITKTEDMEVTQLILQTVYLRS